MQVDKIIQNKQIFYNEEVTVEGYFFKGDNCIINSRSSGSTVCFAYDSSLSDKNRSAPFRTTIPIGLR